MHGKRKNSCNAKHIGQVAEEMLTCIANAVDPAINIIEVSFPDMVSYRTRVCTYGKVAVGSHRPTCQEREGRNDLYMYVCVFFQ